MHLIYKSEPTVNITRQNKVLKMKKVLGQIKEEEEKKTEEKKKKRKEKKKKKKKRKKKKKKKRVCTSK